MNEINLYVAKDNNRDVIQYILEQEDTYDAAAADKAAALGCIVPFSYEDRHGKRSIKAYAPEGVSLTTFMKDTLDKKMVLLVLNGLTSALWIGTMGIPVNYIVRNPDYIYVNSNTMEVKVILMPVRRETPSPLNLPEFFRKIISNMRFNDTDKDNYVASIITIINSSDFSVNKLKTYLNGQLEKMGLPTAAMMPVNKMGVMNSMRPMVPPGAILPGSAMPRDNMYGTETLQDTSMGSLVGQLGTKPVPHLIRKKTGEAINITKPEFTLGKSKTKADYAIDDNGAVSRVHCTILQRNGVNYIKDNNSTNHTYVDGVEVAPGREVLLKNKASIQLGDEEFTFLLRKGE